MTHHSDPRKTVIVVANRKSAREIARNRAKIIGVTNMNKPEGSKNSKQKHNRYGTKRKPKVGSASSPMSWFAKEWRDLLTRKDVEAQCEQAYKAKRV